MKLTIEQRAAVEAAGGPNKQVLLVACPGSGKSTTLVQRILADNVEGSRVIVSTFTQRAGQALKAKLKAQGFEPFYCGTDHGLCLAICRYFDSRTSVMDEESFELLVDSTIKQLRVKTTVPAVIKEMAMPEPSAKLRPVVLQIRATMRNSRCYDFDTILREGAKAAPLFLGGWRLYVDEYQDTTEEQERLYDALPCESRFFVGDPDQSIYGFRGSRIENIMERQKKAQTLHLSGNFRCAPKIVKAANQLISQNKIRLAETDMATAGERAAIEGIVDYFTFPSDAEEATAAASLAQPGDAILVRYNATRVQIEKRLWALGKIATRHEPLPADLARLRAFFAMAINPENTIAQLNYWAATTGSRQRGQEEIEAGRTIKLDLPRNWAELANVLTHWKFSRGAIAAVFDGHQLTGSLDPHDILHALCRREDPLPDPRQIAVLTFHGAKGLEFDRVWIAGADVETEAKLPIEEERRLFYVAMTRAREKLTISRARIRENAYTRRHEQRDPNTFWFEAMIVD